MQFEIRRLAIGGLTAILVAGVFIVLTIQKSHASEVVDKVSIEADSEVWDIATILSKKPAAAIFTADITDNSTDDPDVPDIDLQEDNVIEITANIDQSIVTILAVADTEPPVIEGAKDQVVFAGDRVSYKLNISVKDNIDETLELEIDNSAVNLKKPGAYPVIYSAVDSAGNVATVTATITVKEKPAENFDPEDLYELVDQILAEILEDDMTDVDKAWAIYRWGKTHIGYVNTSDKSDWLKAAMHGITKGTGDCFNFYATARVMLERIGLETQTVTRITDGGKRNIHYWNLVYIEDGWYHFDTIPTIKANDCFLRTDAEVAKFSKEVVKNYYYFDTTLHPATPEDPPEERSKYVS